MTLIEGLENGRAALYLRAHHALTDGVGGVRLLGLAPRRADVAACRPHDPARASPGRGRAIGGNGDRKLGTFTVTVDVSDTVRRLISGVNAARDVSPTDTAVRGVQRVLGVANSVSRQLMVTGGPLTSRPVSRSLFSRFELISVDGARGASLALGGSRNDLLVAAAAAGIGRYHGELGHPAAELRLATPTSQRRGHEVGGNWFAPARLEVPTAVGRPGPQFGVVVERLAQARREPALQVASTVAATLGRLPTRLLLPALHAQADSVDFAATALPGLRGARHICGSLIDALYPLGPRLGCPMNITALGNDDRLDVGIALDHAAVEQPDLLVECLTDAFDSYVTTAASVSSQRGLTRSCLLAHRGRRRRQRRGILNSLLDGATEIVQSVANEVAPGVVDALDVDEVVQRVDVQTIVDKVDVESIVDKRRRAGRRRQGRHRRGHGSGRPAGACSPAST